MRQSLSKAEARLDWREDAAALERRVRALNPRPVAETTLDGAQLRIFESRVVAASPGPVPGHDPLRRRRRHRRHDRGAGARADARAVAGPARRQRGRARELAPACRQGARLSTPGGAAIRAAAARCVVAVAVRGRRLEDAVAAFTRDGVPRPATQSIAFGTVRWYFELDACLARAARPPGRAAGSGSARAPPHRPLPAPACRDAGTRGGLGDGRGRPRARPPARGRARQRGAAPLPARARVDPRERTR